MTWYHTERPTQERLRGSDRRYRRLTQVCHVLWFSWFVTIVLAGGVAWVLVTTALIGVDRKDAVISVAGVAVGAAAGLGGISATLFFITAQLRVAGVARRGLVELYRVRLLVPLLASTVAVILTGSGAILLPDGSSAWPQGLAVFALLALVPFLIAVVHLATLSLVYFEPLSVAHHFADTLTFDDVHEWQLFDLSIRSDSASDRLPLRCTVRSNRMNFGLRDPLMPIQELVENSKNKELGRLEGVLLRRMAHIYRLPWTHQAPDPVMWGREAGEARRFFVPSYARWKSRNVPRPYQRIALLLLILHYFRRLPDNDNIHLIPPDVRRQQTQFLLCRIAFVLAHENPRGFGRHASGSEERRTALVLAVYAIAGLSSEFRHLNSRNTIEPAWALTAVAVALREKRWDAEYALVVQTLAWMKRRTPHIRHSWVAAHKSASTKAGYRRLYRDVRAQLWAVGVDYPTHPDVEDPWRDRRKNRAAA